MHTYVKIYVRKKISPRSSFSIVKPVLGGRLKCQSYDDEYSVQRKRKLRNIKIGSQPSYQLGGAPEELNDHII